MFRRKHPSPEPVEKALPRPRKMISLRTVIENLCIRCENLCAKTVFGMRMGQRQNDFASGRQPARGFHHCFCTVDPKPAIHDKHPFCPDDDANIGNERDALIRDHKNPWCDFCGKSGVDAWLRIRCRPRISGLLCGRNCGQGASDQRGGGSLHQMSAIGRKIGCHRVFLFVGGEV
nr:hypothetical protein [uncultured Roseobacter sp.]